MSTGYIFIPNSSAVPSSQYWTRHGCSSEGLLGWTVFLVAHVQAYSRSPNWEIIWYQPIRRESGIWLMGVPSRQATGPASECDLLIQWRRRQCEKQSSKDARKLSQSPKKILQKKIPQKTFNDLSVNRLDTYGFNFPPRTHDLFKSRGKSLGQNVVLV